jgi:UDP-glucose 4-epimerase
MKSVLVTGAAGFLGYWLARRLAGDPEIEVTVVDNFSRGERDSAYQELCARPNVRAIEADLADPDVVRALPRGFEVVYHLAALNGTQNFYERPWEVVRACTMPTFLLLEHYRRDPRLKRFVYAGTSESYASTVTRFQWPVPTSEDVPLSIDGVQNARWSYAGGKMVGEVAVINALRGLDASYTVIRYHNAYGPRMGDKHVIPDFLERMSRGLYRLYGFEQTRSFIYVEDCIRATCQLAESSAAANEIVNVGGSRELSMLELGKIILRLAGIEAEIECLPGPHGSVMRRAPNTQKMRELLGFEESWRLEEGLRETMRWYLKGFQGAVGAAPAQLR